MLSLKLLNLSHCLLVCLLIASISLTSCQWVLPGYPHGDLQVDHPDDDGSMPPLPEQPVDSGDSGESGDTVVDGWSPFGPAAPSGSGRHRQPLGDVRESRLDPRKYRLQTKN